MANQDDIEWLQESSDPDLAIFVAMYREYAGDSDVSASYQTALSNDRNDITALPTAPAYNTTSLLVETEPHIRRHSIADLPSKPTIDTIQTAYSSSSNNEYGSMAIPSFTISPTDVDNDSKSTLPLEAYSATFNVDFGDRTHLRTPSLDSGTTHETQRSSANDFQWEQDPSWLASTLDLTPRGRGSKRPSIDLGDNLEGRSTSKRARSVQGGFPCNGCAKRFDRACDERKHFSNVHGAKRHGCKLCGSRFTYPKDVGRHLKQVHHIESSEVKSPRRYTSLKSVVSLLSNLSLWSKDPAAEEKQEEYILVTQDHLDYRKIYLKGLETSEALMREIGFAFGMHLGHVDDALLSHGASGGRLGKRIMGPQLMNVVGKAVTAGRTLELFFKPKDDIKDHV